MNGIGLAVLAIMVAAPAAAAEPSPRHDYVLHCAGCHKLDGTGSARVPSLAGVGALLALPGGRAYLVGVPGVAQAPLSDARLAALIDWLVASFGAGAPVPPFTAAEVGRGRAVPLRDPVRVRAHVIAGAHRGDRRAAAPALFR